MQSSRQMSTKSVGPSCFLSTQSTNIFLKNYFSTPFEKRDEAVVKQCSSMYVYYPGRFTASRQFRQFHVLSFFIKNKKKIKESGHEFKSRRWPPVTTFLKNKDLDDSYYSFLR